jgi:2-polyprenyl-6-methoxyphenol hydroxylase-like FAD-dependent oxidoreductase
MSQSRIAIIGAGPAGCVLAKLLTQAGINVTVFERERSPDTRSQGGTLDLHVNSGLAALKEAGLYDEFLKHARFDGTALKVTDKRLKTYINLSGSKEGSSIGRPEIDREWLRKILYDSLPSGTIRWGYHLLQVGDDRTLHFEQEHISGFDLIVGADGAWSKVRPALTEIKPQYSLIGGFQMKISNPQERCPDLYNLVNRGSLFSFSDCRCLTFQQMGDGSLSCHEWTARDEDWDKTQKIDIQNSSTVKSFLLEQYHDWSDEHRSGIQEIDENSIVYRRLHMLPIGNRWKNKPGITLVGDAAHLTVPFAGEGVNIAMKDSMNLARVIIKAEMQGDKAVLEAGVKSFEEDMFRRAEAVQSRSVANMQDMILTEGAPYTSIERYVTRALQSQSGPILGLVVVIPVYLFYWFYKLLYLN